MQLIHQSGDKLFVTTLDISNHFGKQHKDVLEAVRSLECSQEFSRRNFTPTSYNDRQNKARPMYEITRDGFVFLCMGFTGQQAAVWKERYIEAFNQMEKALRGDLLALRRELPLALENGHLKDQLRARDEIIQAKDGVIMTLQDRLISSQGGKSGLFPKWPASRSASATGRSSSSSSAWKPKVNRVTKSQWQAARISTTSASACSSPARKAVCRRRCAMRKPDVLQAEKPTPEAMLQHFVVNFYESFKGDDPAGYFTHLRNVAVEGAYFRGLRQGKEDGYKQALYDMELAQHKGQQFVKKLLGHD